MKEEEGIAHSSFKPRYVVTSWYQVFYGVCCRSYISMLHEKIVAMERIKSV